MRKITPVKGQYLIDEFTAKDTWRIFRIMAEFVEGFEESADLGQAISIFGSARAKPDSFNIKMPKPLLVLR